LPHIKQRMGFRKKCGIVKVLESPQMEYTRFPRASGKPPRASPCGVLPISFLPLESRIFHLLGWLINSYFPHINPNTQQNKHQSGDNKNETTSIFKTCFSGAYLEWNCPQRKLRIRYSI